MKIITLYTSVLILFVIACSSCYKEIDLEKYRPIPRIVINTAIAADSLITANITRTWFFTDTENNPEIYLPDAKVDLYINDVYVERMTWESYESGSSGGCFVSAVIARKGDKIKIVADDKNYGTAWAEEIIPHPIQIEEALINTSLKSDNNVIISYQITFKDIPDERNYYLIQINGVPGAYGYDYWTLLAIDYSFDPVLSRNESIVNNSLGYDGLEHSFGCLFTDELIEGKKYTLKMKETIPLNYLEYSESSSKRIISLYNLSESYYQYLLSLQRLNGSDFSKDLAVIGFAEPLRIYSNVRGGTGILGTSQHDSRDIEIVVK